MEYIFDQTAPGVGEKPLWLSNVRHGGCGAVATFNALVSLGKNPDLDGIIRRYRRRFGLRLGGWAGISLWSVVDFFSSLGYGVQLCADPRKFDELVKRSDAGIFWYLWVSKRNPRRPIGAHFIHVTYRDGRYLCCNLHTGQTQAVESENLRRLMKREAVCSVLLCIREKEKKF